MEETSMSFLKEVVRVYGDKDVADKVNVHVLVLHGFMEGNENVTEEERETIIINAKIAFDDIYMNYKNIECRNIIEELLKKYDKKEISYLLGCSNVTVDRLAEGLSDSVKYMERLIEVKNQIPIGKVQRYDDINREEVIKELKKYINIVEKKVNDDKAYEIIKIEKERYENVKNNMRTYSTSTLYKYSEILRKYIKKNGLNTKEAKKGSQVYYDFNKGKDNKLLMNDGDILKEFNFLMDKFKKDFGITTVSQLAALMGVPQSRIGNMKTRYECVSDIQKRKTLDDMRALKEKMEATGAWKL